jgi:hypothetical protein
MNQHIIFNICKAFINNLNMHVFTCQCGEGRHAALFL